MEKYGYYQGSCGSPPRWGAPGEAHPTMVSCALLWGFFSVWPGNEYTRKSVVILGEAVHISTLNSRMMVFGWGPLSSIWTIFEQELAFAESGEAFHADLQSFQALGVRIVKGIEIQMLQAPINGREDFYVEWNRLKIIEIDEAIMVVE